MSYHKEQKLNDWVDMLHSIYGLSQNYARSEYEILAHLSEVTGAFSKYLFKLAQPDQAKAFLPKMFGWSVALLRKVKADRANFEEVILTKYPCVCSYCASSPCKCLPGKKEPANDALVMSIYNRATPSQGRSLNDFQMMFRKIYEQSWGLQSTKPGSEEAISKLQKMYTRLVEELSELGEAVRFSHLYPSNFDNELADYIAWLFALISSMHYTSATSAEMVLVADLFWPAYPGLCTVCMLDLCDCRPSPARDLQSKPALSDLQYKDALTQAANKARFDRNITEIKTGALPFPVPIACVRIDVDDFRKFNESPFDHSVGDEALKHLANIIRQKIRTRDRLFRVGGDEFAILCPDLSAYEASGMMARVAQALKKKPVPLKSASGATPPPMTLSIGIKECQEPLQIEKDFAEADETAIQSKTAGKDRVTISTTGEVRKSPSSTSSLETVSSDVPELNQAT